MNSNLFMLTLKHYLRTNAKSLGLSAIAVLAIALLFGAVMGYYHRGGGAREIIIFFSMYGFMAGIFSSLMFSDMKTKAGRIGEIMLPSSVFSKYITRWLVFVPGLVILFFVSLYACDGFRILVFKLTSDTAMSPAYTNFINPFALFNFVGPAKMAVTLFFVAAYFLSQSIYMFGAILWPKLSFLKTMLAMWIIEWILAFAAVKVDDYVDFTHLDSTMSLLWTIVGLEFALTIVLYYIGYWRFKNSSVHYRLF